MVIIPATVWGREVTGDAPSLKPKQINELTIHYTGSPSVNLAKQDVAAYIKRTERSHKARPNDNLSTIGYNFIIDEYGRVWEGRGFTYRNGANGTDSNSTSVSVCILVGVKDNKLTPEVIDAVRWLRAHASKKVGRELIVKGHRDHKATSCPGEDVYRLVRNGTFVKPPSGALTPNIPVEPVAPAPAPAPAPTPAPQPAADCQKKTLKWRDKGPCVVLVRHRLKLHGHEVEQGKDSFDRKLVAVVKSFQKTKKLKADGIVGPAETWPALMRKP
jgi:hypothetical protein